jgi:nitrogen fixation-related uncharacterized protein
MFQYIEESSIFIQIPIGLVIFTVSIICLIWIVKMSLYSMVDSFFKRLEDSLKD